MKLRSLKPRRHARLFAARAFRAGWGAKTRRRRDANTRHGTRKTNYHKTKPYDDPKLASHVRYLSANNFADGFVPFIARVISSCVTRFAPIKF